MEVCPTHQDHHFDHYQMLIYVNDMKDKDSKLVILDDDEKTILKEVYPDKFKGLIFDNKPHYHYYPKQGTRWVMVCTFMGVQVGK